VPGLVPHWSWIVVPEASSRRHSDTRFIIREFLIELENAWPLAIVALEETPAMETIMKAERIPTMTMTTNISMRVKDLFIPTK